MVQSQSAATDGDLNGLDTASVDASCGGLFFVLRAMPSRNGHPVECCECGKAWVMQRNGTLEAIAEADR